MKQVGAFQAKTHFSELLAAVSNGEEFAITRHGQKVAILIPFTGQEIGSSSKSAIRAIKNLRKGTRLGKKLSIKKMQTESRK